MDDFESELEEEERWNTDEEEGRRKTKDECCRYITHFLQLLAQ